MCPESVLALHASKSSGVATPGHTWACAQVKIMWKLKVKRPVISMCAGSLSCGRKASSAADKGGGRTGAVYPRLLYKGTLKQCQTHSNKIRFVSHIPV